MSTIKNKALKGEDLEKSNKSVSPIGILKSSTAHPIEPKVAVEEKQEHHVRFAEEVNDQPLIEGYLPPWRPRIDHKETNDSYYGNWGYVEDESGYNRDVAKRNYGRHGVG